MDISQGLKDRDLFDLFGSKSGICLEHSMLIECWLIWNRIFWSLGLDEKNEINERWTGCIWKKNKWGSLISHFKYYDLLLSYSKKISMEEPIYYLFFKSKLHRGNYSFFILCWAILSTIIILSREWLGKYCPSVKT